jgi:protein-S-isoprenylcysteine O-methyltransferase Ste14
MSLSTLWKIFYYAWFASEIYIAVATRTRRGDGNVRDRGTMLLLWIVIFTAIFSGTWVGEAQGPNLPAGSILFGAPWLKPVSLLILLGGLVLRWTAVLILGKSFSANVAIHAAQQVRKTGLYRWMRHPSYTGLLLCIFAVGLHPRNWISLLIVIVPTTAALLYRIHVEEIALREHFGQEYIDYSQETSSLIPGIY